MGRLVDALKRLESRTPQDVDETAVSAWSPAVPELSPADDAELRGETQIAQTLDEAEATLADVQDSLAPQSSETFLLPTDYSAPLPFPQSIPEDSFEITPITASEAKNLDISVQPSEQTSLLPEIPCCAEDHVQATATASQRPAAVPVIPDAWEKIARSICGQLPPGEASALMITSPQDGEGKTEVLLGLVSVLRGLAGGKMVVVDANFRRPTLSRRCASPRGPGLGEFLWGAAPWTAAIQPAAIDGADLLPNFGLPKNLDHMAQPQGFDALLHALREEYPLVLIDAASLAHVETTLFASACDGAYLVVRFGSATRSTVRLAVDVLAQSGSRLWGCIGVGED
jgi:Mrp family chromosome partitioning ATPase